MKKFIPFGFYGTIPLYGVIIAFNVVAVSSGDTGNCKKLTLALLFSDISVIMPSSATWWKDHPRHTTAMVVCFVAAGIDVSGCLA